jgi:predicted ferric reductase
MIFVYLHTQNLAKYYVLWGLGLLALDALFILGTLCLRTHVLEVETKEYNDQNFILVKLNRKCLFSKSGQFAWLWIPSISLYAHPFSIMNNISSEGSVSMLIQVQKRSNRTTWTSKFYEKLISQEYVRVFAIGAFAGLKMRPQSYKRVLLIAGGSGITSILSVWSEFKDVSTLSEVELHWSTRQSGLIEELKDYIYPDAFTSTTAKMSAYIYSTSQQSELHSVEAGSGVAEGTTAVNSLFSIHKHQGRFDVKNLINGMRDKCIQDLVGALAIYVSGPESLVSEVQAQVQKLDSIDLMLHLHAFTYHF